MTEPDARELDSSRPCWWCGGVADSAEHKFKRRDLDQIFGAGAWKGTVAHGTSGDERYGSANSSRSGRFKFSNVLCRDCNNRRSQPFDRAYDVFADYFRAHDIEIHSEGVLDWRAVFGDDWRTEVDRLVGYWIKHIVCRLVEANVLVHPALIAFLDGDGPLAHVDMQLEIREDLAVMERHSLDEHDLSLRGLWMGDMFGWTQGDYGDALVRVESHMSLSWLRMTYAYDFIEPAAHVNFGAERVQLPRLWNFDPATVVTEQCPDCG